MHAFGQRMNENAVNTESMAKQQESSADDILTDLILDLGNRGGEDDEDEDSDREWRGSARRGPDAIISFPHKTNSLTTV